jgi:predicted regulator of Ras-like GTPase activity (Roadblock/LC7/MglB family)
VHWLSEQLAHLDTTVTQLHQLRSGREDGVPTAEERAARAALRDGLTMLVAELSARPGVVASFAAQDGLLVDGQGDRNTLEAMAAMSQTVFHASESAGQALGLGPVRQVLLSGADRKVVFFAVGEVRLGVLAPVDVDLRNVLAT